MMMVIDIPMRVVSESNQRDHWRIAAKRHKEQKNITTLFLICQKIPKNIPVVITLIRKGKGTLDDDNLQGAFKYIRDAVAEYFFPEKSVGMADNHAGFCWQYAQLKMKEYSFSILFEWPSPDSQQSSVK